ncbi:MAG: bifunctional 5,10-methylenetetrahydrofolate dehydrogenase/5,10-methenyltetrahydrofolate cyclohydrolase [Candidatus Gracilibacteria bacterium]|nr:bifunctional 5,10-methylenetetrahydrofolate dehydrogenase/5,10-methenyltetrahydrofolate cyclohydrolase [Candidatus Gracilibacteria bacterium]
MIIDGKKIALEMYNEMKTEISGMQKKPGLGAILVGNNPSSEKYVEQKRKWAEFIGMDFYLYRFREDISEKELVNEVEKLNLDEKISGFIVQLPLPNHISDKKIINSIKREKDVDGFHPINQGKILIGDNSGFSPCTPEGIMKIFSYYEIDLVGKIITVIGKSNIVGKPIRLMLINAGATVISCNSKTPDLSQFTSISDIVISATGNPNLIKSDMVKEDSILIDVGFTFLDGKIYGDMDFENLKDKSSMITPVPGGVGALTVANLLANTLKASKK